MRGAGLVTCAVTVVLVGALASVAAASVTTMAERKAPSKKAYIAAGDALCKQSVQQLNPIVQSAADSLTKGVPLTTLIAQVVQQAAPIVQGELSGLRALTPPKADKKKVSKLLTTFRQELAAIQANPTSFATALAAGSGSLFPKTGRLAKAYGFKTCPFNGVGATL
jgi:hypothetical protein